MLVKHGPDFSGLPDPAPLPSRLTTRARPFPPLARWKVVTSAVIVALLIIAWLANYFYSASPVPFAWTAPLIATAALALWSGMRMVAAVLLTLVTQGTLFVLAWIALFVVYGDNT